MVAILDTEQNSKLKNKKFAQKYLWWILLQFVNKCYSFEVKLIWQVIFMAYGTDRTDFFACSFLITLCCWYDWRYLHIRYRAIVSNEIGRKKAGPMSSISLDLHLLTFPSEIVLRMGTVQFRDFSLLGIKIWGQKRIHASLNSRINLH